MKKITKRILFILTFLAILIISDKAYAASPTLSASSYETTTGKTVNISAGVQSAESWNLQLTASGGVLGGTTKNADAGDGEVTKDIINATFSATTPGSYTITLSGTIASTVDVNNGTPQPVNKSIAITVSAPPPPSTAPSTAPTPTPAPAPTFSSVSETVYTTSQVTFRSSYSTSSSSLGTIPEGAALTRIGVSSTKVDGYYWSKVTYNGRTGYVASSFLTTTKPEEKPSPSPEPEEEKSNDSTLKSLSITGVEFTPAFSSSVLTYIANVGPDVTEVEVKAEVNNEKAKYEITGNKDLQDGENSVIITVTAEDGTVTNYEIKLIKGEEQIPLDVFKIVGIKENDEKIDIALDNPAFIDGNVEYSINLSEYMKSIDIQALLSSDVNQYEGIGIFDLVVGENNFTVLLKQQQGEGKETKTTEYRITINNPEKIVEQPVMETKEDSKINFKLIIAIGAVAVITAAGITFAVLYYKKQNALEYAKPDYSFLREDEEVQSKEQKRTEEIEKNNIVDEENNDDGEPRRRGGKHF